MGKTKELKLSAPARARLRRRSRELHQVFIRLWRWCELHPHSSKSWWPEWKSNGGTVEASLNACPACQLTQEIESWVRAERTDSSTSSCPCACGGCPVRWPVPATATAKARADATRHRGCMQGLYMDWCDALGKPKGLSRRRALAQRIQLLPWALWGWNLDGTRRRGLVLKATGNQYP